MYDLTEALAERMKNHELLIPIFTVASVDDKTVVTQTTIEFMARQINPCNKFILYSTEPISADEDTLSNKIEWIKSVLPEKKILSSSHTAIVVAPPKTPQKDRLRTHEALVIHLSDPFAPACLAPFIDELSQEAESRNW